MKRKKSAKTAANEETAMLDYRHDEAKRKKKEMWSQIATT